MGWNHRVMAHKTEEENKLYYQIHEVMYDDDTPRNYTVKGVEVGGESVEDCKWVLEQMLECLKKPVLWYGDRFPEEVRTLNKGYMLDKDGKKI